MSTTEDPASTSGTAEQQASALLGSDIREGYAEVGDVRLQEAERVNELLTDFFAPPCQPGTDGPCPQGRPRPAGRCRP